MIVAFTFGHLVDFSLGTIVGAGLVGSSVHRTLSVASGNFGHTFTSAHLNSLFYYFSIYFIAKDNLTAYLGTCLGSWAIVMYMCYKNRSKNDNKHSTQPASDRQMSSIRAGKNRAVRRFISQKGGSSQV